MTTAAIAAETLADLAAHHVHAQVTDDGHDHVTMTVEAGTSAEERDAAAAILWLHLHRAAASEVH